MDKFDFLNDVNKEKKVFERTLDDCVACGMDQSIQVRNANKGLNGSSIIKCLCM